MVRVGYNTRIKNSAAYQSFFTENDDKLQIINNTIYNDERRQGNSRNHMELSYALALLHIDCLFTIIYGFYNETYNLSDDYTDIELADIKHRASLKGYKLWQV